MFALLLYPAIITIVTLLPFILFTFTHLPLSFLYITLIHLYHLRHHNNQIIALEPGPGQRHQ